MKNLTLGILAHVDAGKTTLSEALLYTCGAIRKIGRVDHRDAFLDTASMERDRGITIYSKQAVFDLGDVKVTLLDTPGHADFSAEMERVLRVLDYAVLVISGSDGIQSHTATLWKLLENYDVPAFIFVNKMDMPGCSRAALMDELKSRLGEGCIDFSSVPSGDTGTDVNSGGPEILRASSEWLEEAALCDENLLEHFLETGEILHADLVSAIRNRRIFPFCFGSALKLEGVKEFTELLRALAKPAERPKEFGARAFKITHDENGARLTHLKITGGSLSLRDTLSGTDANGDSWSEKVSRIRIYNGAKFTEVPQASAGTVCAVTGLSRSTQRQGFGFEPDSEGPLLHPVLSYKLNLPSGTDPAQFYRKLQILEDEDPELHFSWTENAGEIHVRVMGEVQMEILAADILSRLETEISFSDGSVMYRETIEKTVEGVGHFEPLRHYAEVHLLMEPGPRGSGVQITSGVSEDLLDRNWQRLILTHLYEREHLGVLTGSPLTDIKITLAAGRAHTKHTEGGDFRQATYRAVRQGLMEAGCVLLEPYYSYTITLPSGMVGRAMTDLDSMGASQGELQQNETFAVLTGTAPVSAIGNYQKEVTSYTHGEGLMTLAFAGYDRCMNAGEVIAEKGYDPEADLPHTPHSVFCTHGAGTIVPWNEVKQHMHLPSVLAARDADPAGDRSAADSAPEASGSGELWISPEEVEQIISRTYYSNRKEERRSSFRKNIRKKTVPDTGDIARVHIQHRDLEKYLLIDGYNVIFAWKELADLAGSDIDAARDHLLDILVNYRAMIDSEIIAVFDAYRVQNHPVTAYEHGTVNVVFTETAQTADSYIEKFVHDNRNRYDITVVTSDGLEQIIIRGQDAKLMSSREFESEVQEMNRRIRQMLAEHSTTAPRNRLELSELKAKLEQEQQ